MVFSVPAMSSTASSSSFSVLRALASPGPSKADQTGTRWGNFMAYIQLDRDTPTTNAAWWMLVLERAWPCQHMTQRKATPLFMAASATQPFTHSRLNKLLVDMMSTVAGLYPHIHNASRNNRYSWHSFRIALACALRALKRPDGSRAVTDPTIQALYRWATPQSLEVYARINRTDYAALVQEAIQVKFDSVQARTLLDSVPMVDDDRKFAFMDQMIPMSTGSEVVSRSAMSCGEGSIISLLPRNHTILALVHQPQEPSPSTRSAFLKPVFLQMAIMAFTETQYMEVWSMRCLPTSVPSGNVNIASTRS